MRARAYGHRLCTNLVYEPSNGQSGRATGTVEIILLDSATVQECGVALEDSATRG